MWDASLVDVVSMWVLFFIMWVLFFILCKLNKK